MSPKTVAIPLIACAATYAAATLLMGKSEPPAAPAHVNKTVPPAEKDDDDRPTIVFAPGPKVEDPPPEKPVPAPKPDPTTAAAESPAAEKPAPKPESKPVTPTSAVLKRWKVPPMTVPAKQNHFFQVYGVAINDDGSRVLVINHPAVDIWDPAAVSYTRVLPVWNSSGYCIAVLSPSATHFHIRNDKAKTLETYDAEGKRVGSTPQIGFNTSFDLVRPGYDISPQVHLLAVNLPEVGVYAIDPKTGALKNILPMKDIWDASGLAVVREPGGDFLVYFNRSPNDRKGLYRFSSDGKVAKVPGGPSPALAARVVDEIALSRDGRYVAFQGSERLEIWDIKTAKLVLDWREEYRVPRAGRFTGDGRLAVMSVKTSVRDIATSNVSGGYANASARLDVVELSSLQTAGKLNLSDFDVMESPAFAFSPSGRRLAVADWKQIALIDVEKAFPSR